MELLFTTATVTFSAMMTYTQLVHANTRPGSVA